MSHPYFFVKSENISGDKIIIKGDDFNHLINVLRVKTGGMVEISDNIRYRYKARLEQIKKQEGFLSVVEKERIYKQLPEITLFQCILKKEAMELAVQKTAEIGIAEIVPVFSRRVILDESKIKNKRERWQTIAEQASKQCRRDFICSVLDPLNIDEILPSKYSLFYIPYEEASADGIVNGTINTNVYADKIFKDIDCKMKNGDLKNIGYVIGPEGGFEESEAKLLRTRGAAIVSLGRNILRAETASIYFLSILDFVIKNSHEQK